VKSIDEYHEWMSAGKPFWVVSDRGVLRYSDIKYIIAWENTVVLCQSDRPSNGIPMSEVFMSFAEATVHFSDKYGEELYSDHVKEDVASILGVDTSDLIAVANNLRNVMDAMFRTEVPDRDRHYEALKSLVARHGCIPFIEDVLKYLLSGSGCSSIDELRKVVSDGRFKEFVSKRQRDSDAVPFP